MTGILAGVTVVEAASFVAAPSAGLYLAQLGATVIRVDQTGGGPDYRRWPLAGNGASHYWEALNRGKQSVAVDLGRAEGRELLAALATAPGTDLFLTNFPVQGFLSHDRLAARRADLITLRVMGSHDGGPALDYTVNAALGLPFITGPMELGDTPVNHVLPAWDLLTGAMAALAGLAALRHREATGQGQEVRLPLADVGLASIANLGMVAEALAGTPRPRLGNEVFGALGRDYVTACGRRLMVIAITPKQWAGLVQALGISEAVAAVEAARGVSFATDEGLRFQHRDALHPIIACAIAARRHDDLLAAFQPLGVCFGDYATLAEAAASTASHPLFSPVSQPSGTTSPLPGFPARFTGLDTAPERPARLLGADTAAVLAERLGLAADAIAALQDKGVTA
ncbi:MAG: CoA transferase [Sphingomonadales bacterium]